MNTETREQLVNVRTVEVYKNPVKLAEGERIVGANVTWDTDGAWIRTWLVVVGEVQS